MSVHSAGAYTATLLVMVNVMRGGGRAPCTPHPHQPGLQGADNKLGQFLGQDFEASANHKNVLRHSLESYSSLVSRSVIKPSLVTEICRQSTKLLQLSKKLCALGRYQQGTEKFLKVHRSLVYLLKTVLNQNQDIGEADVTPVQNQHKNGLLAS